LPNRASRDHGFVPELESLRGIAALLVAGFHAAQAEVTVAGETHRLLQPYSQEVVSAWQPIAWCFHLLVQGSNCLLHPAVLFFFVLSGFVLTASIDAQSEGPRNTSIRFVVGRLFRIYPAVIAAIGLFCLIYFVSGVTLAPDDAFSLKSIFKNMLLVTPTIDGVMWSLRAEIVALPLILGGALLGRTRGAPWLWPLAVLLAGLSFSKAWSNFGASPALSFLAWLYVFVFGILAFHVGKKAVVHLGASTALLLGAGSIVLFIAIPQLLGPTSRWVQVFQAVLAGTLISALTFAPGTVLNRCLNVRPLRFYGRISYSFYLLSPLSLLVIWRMPETIGAWIEIGIPRTAIALLLWIVTTIAVTPIAMLSHRYVELPGIAFGKRLLSRRAAITPVNPRAAGAT
jgi:peptidoglycan/LPS O-acetylase OafA/YrhL